MRFFYRRRRGLPARNLARRVRPYLGSQHRRLVRRDRRDRPRLVRDCRGRPYHLHAQLAPSPQSMGSSFVFASWASQLRRAFARQKATSPSCARPKQQPHAFLASFRRPRLLPRRTRKCARPCRERYLRFKKRPFGRFDGISSRKVVDKSYDKSWSRAPLLSVDFVRNFAEHELPRSSRRGR